MKSQAISWWFTPFYYPYHSTGSTTKDAIDTHYNRLLENNKEPSLLKKLTPARATSLTMSSLGLISFLAGLFKENKKLSITGALISIMGVASIWSDRFFLKNNTSPNEPSDTPLAPQPIATETPHTKSEHKEDTTLNSEREETQATSLSENELLFYTDIAFNNPNTPLSNKKNALTKLKSYGQRKSDDELIEALFNKNSSIKLWAFVSMMERKSLDRVISTLLNNLDNQGVINTLLEATKLDPDLFENIPEIACSILKAGHSTTGSVKLLKALSTVPKSVYEK